MAATIAFLVADPGFCRGRQLQRWALKVIIQPIFPLDLHENEGNWTQSVFCFPAFIAKLQSLQFVAIQPIASSVQTVWAWAFTGLYGGAFHTDLILDSCNCDCLHYLYSMPVVAGVCYAILTRNPRMSSQRIKYPPGWDLIGLTWLCFCIYVRLTISYACVLNLIFISINCI